MLAAVVVMVVVQVVVGHVCSHGVAEYSSNYSEALLRNHHRCLVLCRGAARTEATVVEPVATGKTTATSRAVAGFHARAHARVTQAVRATTTVGVMTFHSRPAKSPGPAASMPMPVPMYLLPVVDATVLIVPGAAAAATAAATAAAVLAAVVEVLTAASTCECEGSTQGCGVGGQTYRYPCEGQTEQQRQQCVPHIAMRRRRSHRCLRQKLGGVHVFRQLIR
jgi:hypothetical protein